MKPTEGTILTVVRMAASAGKKTAATTNDVVAVMDAIYEASKSALEKTPDLLPVLKQVGVVDSGGQGLVFVLEAFDDVLNGRDESESGDYQPNDAEMNQMIKVANQSVQSKLNPEDIVYGYCTQIMVRIGKGREVNHQFDYQTFYDYLAKLGDSLLVINDDDIVKVHVHTEHPGKVLAWGRSLVIWQPLKLITCDFNKKQSSKMMMKPLIRMIHQSKELKVSVPSNQCQIQLLFPFHLVKG